VNPLEEGRTRLIGPVRKEGDFDSLIKCVSWSVSQPGKGRWLCNCLDFQSPVLSGFLSRKEEGGEGVGEERSDTEKLQTHFIAALGGERISAVGGGGGGWGGGRSESRGEGAGHLRRCRSEDTGEVWAQVR